MHRVVFAAFMLTFCLGGAAAQSAGPAANWSGPYLGGTVGGVWMDARTDFNPTGEWLNGPANLADAAVVSVLGARDQRKGGLSAGASAGFNWQNGAVVFGLEADASYLDLQRTDSTPWTLVPLTGSSYTMATTSGLQGMFTLRPRAGVAINSLLVYATGGWAYAKRNFSQDLKQDALNYGQTGSASKWDSGWVIGGGIEAALSPRWSVKTEYLYADFGTVSVQSGGTCDVAFAAACALYTAEHRQKLTSQMVRVGLNYRFGH
jgi:outer membrane immunogenic protein